jgi:hypothetical protein
MFGIHRTDGFCGRANAFMCSYKSFCPNAVQAGRIGITQPWDRTTDTYDRLWTGDGTYAGYVGVGPQVAVRMPAGA